MKKGICCVLALAWMGVAIADASAGDRRGRRYATSRSYVPTQSYASTQSPNERTVTEERSDGSLKSVTENQTTKLPMPVENPHAATSVIPAGAVTNAPAVIREVPAVYYRPAPPMIYYSGNCVGGG